MEAGTTRRAVLVAGIGAGLAGLWTSRGGAGAEGSCAVAPAVATARAEGTTIEPIGYGVPASTPGYGLRLYRFTLPPRGEVPPHHHPGATILAVEEGELGYTLLRGGASVQRGGGRGEEVAVGVETVLRVGDALFYDMDAAHTARNPGEVPVVVLSVTLLASDRPATIPTDEDGMEMG